MSKKQICDILVIVPKGRNITEAHDSSICAILKWKTVTMMTGRFHMFHQPIKNELTGTTGSSIPKELLFKTYWI